MALNAECGLVKTVFDTVKTKTQEYSDGITSWFSFSIDKLFEETTEENGETPEVRTTQDDDIVKGKEIFRSAYNGLRDGISMVGETVLGDNTTKPTGEKKGFITNLFDKVENYTILAKDKIVEESKILREKSKAIGVGLTSIIFPNRSKFNSKKATTVTTSTDMSKQITPKTQPDPEKPYLPNSEISFQLDAEIPKNPFTKLIFQPDPELPQWAKSDIISFPPKYVFPEHPTSEIPVQSELLQLSNGETMFQSDVLHKAADTSNAPDALNTPILSNIFSEAQPEAFNPKMFLRTNSRADNVTSEPELPQSATTSHSVSSTAFPNRSTARTTVTSNRHNISKI